MNEKKTCLRLLENTDNTTETITAANIDSATVARPQFWNADRACCPRNMVSHLDTSQVVEDFLLPILLNDFFIHMIYLDIRNRIVVMHFLNDDMFLWDVNTNHCSNFNGNLSKSALKLGHVEVISPHIVNMVWCFCSGVIVGTNGFRPLPQFYELIIRLNHDSTWNDIKHVWDFVLKIKFEGCSRFQYWL